MNMNDRHIVGKKQRNFYGYLEKQHATKQKSKVSLCSINRCIKKSIATLKKK